MLVLAVLGACCVLGAVVYYGGKARTPVIAADTPVRQKPARLPAKITPKVQRSPRSQTSAAPVEPKSIEVETQESTAEPSSAISTDALIPSLAPEETANTLELIDLSIPTTSEKPEATRYETRGARLKQGRKLTAFASGLMRQRRYSEAVLILRNAQKAFPAGTSDLSYGEALYKLGICLRMSGRSKEAITVLRQAMNFPYYRAGAMREFQAAANQTAPKTTASRKATAHRR